MVAGTRVKFWFSICKARAMRIKEFLAIDAVEQADGDLDQDVTGLAYDSRKAGAGQIFFAVPGEKVDGHDFIADAVRRGAAAVVFSREGNWPHASAAVRVKDTRRALALWAAHFFDRPSTKLTLVGITGTNGKTTLSYLIESMLQAAARDPGVIGTISYRYRGSRGAVASHDARVVRFARDARRDGPSRSQVRRDGSIFARSGSG